MGLPNGPADPPPRLPTGIEGMPEDLLTHALSRPDGMIVLVAYLRGKLAGYQLGRNEAPK